MGFITCRAQRVAVLFLQMVEETSEALSWALDNAQTRYSGDPSHISCMGHSAGAHLAALALLHRCVYGGVCVFQDHQSKHRIPAEGLGWLLVLASCA